MKKIKLFIITTIMCLSTFGCMKQDAYDNISINVTSYPIEYIINYIYGDYSTITSIYPSGLDINTYELTPKQIKDISKSDMFIYNGLSKEKNIASQVLKKNKNIDIMDISKGLEVDYNESELWLSPTNFLMIASNIKNQLKEYVTNQKILDDIEKNYNKLKVEISEINVEFKTIAQYSTSNKLVVANNTFYYLKDYGFDVISIDENENSNTNLSQAKKLIQNKNIDYIFVLSGYKETEEIKELTSAGATIVEIPSLYQITEDQRKSKQDYIYFIKDMIEKIKLEVY